MPTSGHSRQEIAADRAIDEEQLLERYEQYAPALLAWAHLRIAPYFLGWQDPGGFFRLTAGYYIGAWFNTLTTPTFVNAVENNNFADADDTLTFDGLTVRAQLNF